jgi:manganese/iron transport system permease protein/iron/zinc/copper transport system permease protein
MLWLSSLLGGVAGGVGMYASYHLEIPSGTTIVLVNATVFAVVLAVTRQRGLRRAAGMDDHADLAPVVPAAAALR